MMVMVTLIPFGSNGQQCILGRAIALLAPAVGAPPPRSYLCCTIRPIFDTGSADSGKVGNCKTLVTEIKKTSISYGSGSADVGNWEGWRKTWLEE